ncbi:MAG: cobalt-zinc-cadmium efflux system outer membrane protein [Myxococcota bacterium]|jgi:cobalt-zinc-cadmium efflux system outer membrane protein
MVAQYKEQCSGAFGNRPVAVRTFKTTARLMNIQQASSNIRPSPVASGPRHALSRPILHAGTARAVTAGVTRFPILVLILGLAGCAGTGTRLLDAYPDLQPGQTTWERWSQRARSSRDTAADSSLPASLSELVAMALDRNPGVRAAWHAWQGRIDAVAPAGILPNPRLTYTWMAQPVETRVGPNEHRMSVTQPIPSPPRLIAQHRRAVARSVVGRFGYEAAVVNAIADLKSSVGQLRFLQRALVITAKNEALAAELAGAAATRAVQDRGLLFDVNKARSQLAQLQYDRVRYDELLLAARARLNALLDRSPSAEIPQFDAWPQSPLPESLEALYARALAHDPRLKQWDARIQAGQAGVSDANGRFFPNLSISLQYLVNGEAAMEGVADSGKDAIGLMVGLEVPIWFGADAGRVGSAESELATRVEGKRAHVNKLLADVQSVLYRLRNAVRLVALYDGTLLPEAHKAMADAEAWYREGAGGFTDFLEARAAWNRFELARERADADRVSAEAALERLLGQALTP